MIVAATARPAGRHRWTRSPLLLLAACLLASLPCQGDSLLLRDGRYFEVRKLTEEEGGFKSWYDHGEVFVPAELVSEYAILSADGEYLPKNEEEREKVDRGLVPYEGKWIKKGKRDRLIAKRNKELQERIEEARAHQKWRNRYQIDSRHFRFEYTIPSEKGQEYQELMETYYGVFMKAWRIKPARGTGRLTVCFYHDPEYYYQVSGAPRGAIGYFRFVDPIELNFYYDRNDERLTLDVMFHETNHYLTYLIDPEFDYPDWVNEGLAEYYGASQWDPETGKMTIGHLQEGRLVVLQDAIAGDEWLGLEEMIRMEDFAAIHYAWGWSFVHYLLETPKYAARFKKFYLALAKDRKLDRVRKSWGMKYVPVEEQLKAFKKYMGLRDLKTLEEEWHAYVKDILKIETHRGYEQAAEWAEQWGLTIRAGRYYKTAIEMGTQNPLTFDNYGEWCMRKNKPEDAVEQFDRAIALDPFNAYFYLHKAHALQRIGGDENTEEAERLEKLALEIDPDDPWLELQTKTIRIKSD